MVGADYKNGSLEQYTRSSHTPLPRHRRRTSISMPGSLFSRSPTPDEHPTTRHVRFDSSIISPVPHRQRPMSRRTSQVETMEPQDEEPMEDEGGDEDVDHYEEQDSASHSDDEYESHSSSDLPSPGHTASHKYPSLSPSKRLVSAVAGPSSNSFPATSFRPPAIRSVKDVVTRLDEDSPSRPVTPSWSAKGKGKARYVEVEPQSPRPLKDKGKSKERTASPCANAVATIEDPRGDRIDEETARKRIRELEEKVRSLENEVFQSHCIYLFQIFI